MTSSRLVACGLALVFTASCAQKSVPRSRLADSPPSHARLALVDGTKLAVDGPVLGDDGWVRGTIDDCTGASCALAYENRGVPFDRIDTVEIREISGGAVLALIVVSTVVVLTTTVIASASSSTKSTSSSSSSGGSGSSGNGDYLGDMSCPRVYSWDGKVFHLDSGTFGGSMVAATQLTDHDVLEHLAPVDGKYLLRLKNELPETEYTDALALRVIDHPIGTRVVPTPDGKLLTFRDPVRPFRATDLRGRDVLTQVAARDGVEFRSDVSGRRPDVPADLRDGLLLSFRRPANATTAKVWITARNSAWSSTMLDYFFAHLGPAYPAFLDRLEVDPAARMAFDDFLARDGMLHVRAGKTEQRLHLIGPEILQDQAMELPVEGSGDTFDLRLEATTAFWNIDSVAVSFEGDEHVVVKDVAPRAAIAHDGKDVLATLAKVDGDRFVTETGQFADVTFDAPPSTGGARTVILVSTGYYRPHVAPAKDADPAAMMQVLSTPGAAAARSLSMLEVATAHLVLR